MRYGGRLRNREDNNLGSIKMKIPLFQGKNDLEVYLEWERKTREKSSFSKKGKTVISIEKP